MLDRNSKMSELINLLYQLMDQDNEKELCLIRDWIYDVQSRFSAHPTERGEASRANMDFDSLFV